MDLCDIKNIDSWPFPRFSAAAADVSLLDHHHFEMNGDVSFSSSYDFRGRSYINICSWSLLCTKPTTSTTRRMWEFHGERLGLPISHNIFFLVPIRPLLMTWADSGVRRRVVIILLAPTVVTQTCHKRIIWHASGENTLIVLNVCGADALNIFFVQIHIANSGFASDRSLFSFYSRVRKGSAEYAWKWLKGAGRKIIFIF